MAKLRRPFEDETIFFPCYRHLYAPTVMGRATGDAREEPVKYSQALSECIQYEVNQEWNARLVENTVAANKYISGELEEEAKALEKTLGMMSDMGVDQLTAGIESGNMEAMAGIDKGLDMASDATALEMMDDILVLDMFTAYGFHPPIIALPIRLSPAILTLLLGASHDNCYFNVDAFTREITPFMENWHYEDGVQMSRYSYWYDNAEDILKRRHMRTGEPFQYISCQRAFGEGSMMIRDILLDIRNERTPEYSGSSFYSFPYTTIIGPDCQSATRSLYELIAGIIYSVLAFQVGFPYFPYITWVPRPGLVSMLIDANLPIDMLIPRFIELLAGVNFWLGCYNLTHLETNGEVIGQEMIIPSPMESSSAYIRYGMDMIRYPSTMVQSKYIYGQETHDIRMPSEYPCPEKKIMGVADADAEIKKAREEHPEWLTDIKGFGR